MLKLKLYKSGPKFYFLHSHFPCLFATKLSQDLTKIERFIRIRYQIGFVVFFPLFLSGLKIMMFGSRSKKKNCALCTKNK